MKSLKTLHRRIRAKHVFIALVSLTALLVPAMAFAIPGAGEFTSLESATGREMSELYNLIAKICLVIFVIVCAVLFGAILRFRRRSEDEMPEQTHGNFKVEMGLLIAASVTQIFIGAKTIDVMWYVETIPETQMTVEAIGYQWDWQFRYPDHGGFVSEDLVIPAYTNVKLEITSKDVIHSLFIPELGVKMDAVPGRFNYWWVNADGPLNQVVAEDRRSREVRKARLANRKTTTRPDNMPLLKVLNALTLTDEAERPETLEGLEREVSYLADGRAGQIGDGRYAKYDAVEYRGMCTELCGRGHYDMYFRVVAMTPSSFEQWIEDQKSGGSGEANGSEIYASKCASCHGAEGEGVAGQFPPLAGSEWVNEDNEENKRRHIQVVLEGLKGEIEVLGQKYNGVMQPWFNVFNDEEVAAVVNHERISWGNNGGEVDAKLVAEVRKDLGYPPYPAGGAIPVDEKDLIANGEKIYDACVTCHGADGTMGPAVLTKSPMVKSDIEGYVSMLVNGVAGKKSAMGRSMNNYDIASLITYTRNKFGDGASAVQPAEVERIRKDVTKPLN